MATVDTRAIEIMPETESEVAQCVVSDDGIYPVRRWLVLPNAKWGAGLSWEADLLALSPTNYMHEIEIKVTMQDLRKDQHKAKFWQRPQTKMRKFWYAMPKHLATNDEVNDHIPDYAGILSCYIRRGKHHSYFLSEIIKPAKINSVAKLTKKHRTNLCRLAMMRYWSLHGKKCKADLTEFYKQL